MRVVIDTCVICDDLLLRGSDFRTFLKGLGPAGHSLHIPHIVLDEAEGKFREWVRKHAIDTDKSSRRLGLDDLIGVSPLGRQVDDAIRVYAAHLSRRFAEAGASILDYPNCPHSYLTKKAILRSKPFSEKGTGYRDALIWETVRDLAAVAGDQIAFITGNKSDFAGESGLHPDLVSELTRDGLGRDSVRLFGSLRAFVNEQILGKLPPAAQLNLSFAARTGDYLVMLTAVNDAREQYLVGHEIDDIRGLPMDSSCESCSVDWAEPLEDVEVMSYDALSEDEYVVDLQGSTELTIGVFIFKADLWCLPDDDHIEIQNSDWNDHYALGSYTFPATLSLRVNLTGDLAKVVAMSIIDIHAGLSD